MLLECGQTPTQKNIDQYPAQEDGWEYINNMYKPLWFVGPQMPDNLIPDQSLRDEDSVMEEDSDVDLVVSSDDESEISDVD